MTSSFQVNTLYPKVLSIQSSVVFGYVGNKASVFGLHARNIEVDPLNTCQFSNHTGYDSWSGPKTTGEELTSIIEGMDKNKLLPQYTHLLTGYIATQSFIETLPHVITQLKQRRAEYCAPQNSFLQQDPQCLYLCDPVLGDNGSMYVPAKFLEVYKRQLLPLADIVTPNETELSLLTQTDKNANFVNIDDREDELNNKGADADDGGVPQFKSLSQVQDACLSLHNMGPKLIVVTSMKDYVGTTGAAQDDEEKKEKNIYNIEIPADFTSGYLRKCLGLRGADQQLPQCLIDEINVKTQPVGTVCCLVSIKEQHEVQQFCVKLPLFDGYIVGTGDLTASLIMAYLQQEPCDTEQTDASNTTDRNARRITHAVAKVLATIHAVIRATLIRAFVGEHCVQCCACLSKLAHNVEYLQNPQCPLLNKDVLLAEVLKAKAEGGAVPEEKQYQANVVPMPLELWLTGAYQEFLSPSCVVTPVKLDVKQ